MEYLPKDPGMLVSAVNMLLRDEEFDSLESLCFHFNKEPEEIKSYLQEQGFVFDEEQKQFRPIGYKQVSEVLFVPLSSSYVDVTK